MRSSWMLVGSLVFLLATAGCETTQPLQLSDRTLEFRVEGRGGSTYSYHVWNMYWDENNNEEQDANEPTYLYCQDTGYAPAPRVSSPFSFTIEALILRAGSTQWEPLTGGGGLNFDDNLALYDFSDPQSGLTPTKQPITINVGGEMRTYRFSTDSTELRVLSTVNRDVVAATENPLHTFDPATYPLGDGLCSNYDPGVARVANEPLPFLLSLNKGDTIKIEARRAASPPTGLTYAIEPGLTMLLEFDGQPVSVQGDNEAENVPGDGISFTYTFR